MTRAQAEAAAASEAASGSQRTLDALNAAEQAREEAVQLAATTEREATQLAERLAAAETERGQLQQELVAARRQLDAAASGGSQEAATLRRELEFVQEQLKRKRCASVIKPWRNCPAPAVHAVLRWSEGNTARSLETGGAKQVSFRLAVGVVGHRIIYGRRLAPKSRVDAAFAAASDVLPQRSDPSAANCGMRLINGEPIIDSVRGELGLRYVRFDQLVDVLCQSLPEQCR